jgi:hypothetical protein
MVVTAEAAVTDRVGMLAPNTNAMHGTTAAVPDRPIIVDVVTLRAAAPGARQPL